MLLFNTTCGGEKCAKKKQKGLGGGIRYADRLGIVVEKSAQGQRKGRWNKRDVSPITIL